MKTLKSILSAVFFTATAIASHGNIMPVSSSLFVDADANAGASPAQNSRTVSQTTTLNPLTNSITVQALNGGLHATVGSFLAASWTSASAGGFTIGDTFDTSDVSGYSSSRMALDGSSWTYTLRSDVPATLTLNYSVTYSGPNAYAAILDFQQYLGDTVQVGNVVQEAIIVEAPSPEPPVSGTAQFSLNANTDYTFLAFDDSNINNYRGAFTSILNSNFSFQISPVPEPSSLALAGMAALIAVGTKLKFRAPASK
jgi:hypothetical protein